MTFPAEVCVCEFCQKPGTLLCYRAKLPLVGRECEVLKVLCVACGALFKLPRWFA